MICGSENSYFRMRNMLKGVRLRIGSNKRRQRERESGLILDAG